MVMGRARKVKKVGDERWEVSWMTVVMLAE